MTSTGVLLCAIVHPDRSSMVLQSLMFGSLPYAISCLLLMHQACAASRQRCTAHELELPVRSLYHMKASSLSALKLQLRYSLALSD